MRRQSALLGVILLALIASMDCAHASDAAGYVLSILQCNQGCVRVHNGYRLAVARYDEVFSGDRILISRPDQRVTLVYYNESGRTPLSSADSPYNVHAARPDWVRAAENFVDTIRNGLSRSKEKYTALSTRGPISGFKPNCLEAGTARIGDGVRILGFAWHDSVPPYAVTVYDPGSKALLSETNVMHSEFAKVSEPVSLSLGTYRVLLSDGSGKTIERRFEVISARDIPVPPADLLDSTGSAGGKAILRADWLAWSGKGDFCYEAYLSLIPFTFGGQADPDARGAQVDIREDGVSQ
jgi:hypothetical protein